jgi:hypothetical protein
MEWFKELCSTIGTELISAIIGVLVGGTAGSIIGYKMAVKNKVKQKQNAGDDSNQNQVGSININGK